MYHSEIAIFPEGYSGDSSILESREVLAGGIWPRRFELWMAAFYLALFIIRPWELLLPWLAVIHFERLYAITMILVVAGTCGIRLRWSSQTAAVFSFFAAIGISAVCAWKPELAGDGVYAYLTLVVFYVALVSVVRTPYELSFIVVCYVVTMAVYLAKAEWDFFVNSAVWSYDSGRMTRMFGIEDTFGHPNYLAESIVVSLPMLLFLFRVRHQFTATWPRIWRLWFGWGLGGYLLLALTSLVFTNSRAGVATLVVFLVLVSLRGGGLGRKALYLCMGSLLMIGGWFVLPAEHQNRFRTLWDPEGGPEYARRSGEGRLAGFRAGIEMCRRFPATGVGVGNFRPYRKECVDGIDLDAHSLPGQLLGETGLLGGACFLLMIGATLLNCRQVRLFTRGKACPTLDILAELSFAVRTSLMLLLFEGLAIHNVYRFNYLWLAAFSLLSAQFASRICGAEETVIGEQLAGDLLPLSY
ncbi:MAG: O-antigen ligase family protein [Thermoguttaceae bacterium]|jgi:O-antigen ligase